MKAGISIMPARQEEMDIDSRRKAILELLKYDEKIKVADLKEKFNISDVTLRGDLKELEQKGLLRRVHGGAVSTQKAYFSMSLDDRMNTNREEKIQIAKAVASMVSEGNTLMLDSGTTTLYVAQELVSFRNLTVVTNSIRIAEVLSGQNHISVILLGGNLDPKYKFIFGDDALNQLQKYKADKMIVATDGVTSDKGLTTYHYMEAEVSRQMIKRANETIAVADHTKIGKEGFAFIDTIESIGMLITNKNADKNEIASIREKGITVKQV